MSLETIWAKRKEPDGYLPEDGQYFGTVSSCDSKTTPKGYELFEIKIRVNEGPYAGQEVTKNIFYYNPEKPDETRGIKELNALMERTDPRISDLDDFMQAIMAFENTLPGRPVTFEQKKSKDPRYINIWIHEVFDAPAPRAASAPVSAAVAAHAPLKEEVPF